MGGAFTTVGGQARNNIARLDPTTGAVDSFNPNPNSNPFINGVYSIAIQPDGKILAGGTFFSIGGQPRNHIARLDPATGLADSFDPKAQGSQYMDPVKTIVVQPDGKILLGGAFTNLSPNGGTAVTRNRMARVETDGRLDRTLDLSIVNGTNNIVRANAVQADGKVLIGGYFSTVLGVGRNNIARLNSDGSLDTTFNPNSNAEVNVLAVQADGKILVGGVFNSIGGQARNYMARLDPMTGLADSFNPNSNSSLNSIALQTDGKIVVGGYFSGANSIGGQTRNYIARLDSTTGLADSFNPNADVGVITVAIQGGRQDFSPRVFHTHRRTDAQPYCPA